ncbi:hypothetical protein [Pseudoalteromonas xiamenensis]
MVQCKFCLEEKDTLEVSHIVPKFVYKWLKSSSSTGRMRDGRNVNKPSQDGYKTPLLCSTCENKFSANESHFSSFVFAPMTKNNGFVDSSKINWSKFDMFTLSLLWRALYVTANTPEVNKDYYPDEIIEFNKCAEKIKSAFENKGVIPFKTYFIPLNEHSYSNGVIGIEDYVYFERSVAVNLIVDDNNNQASALYIKLPYILIVCEVLNFKHSEWKGLELSARENFNCSNSKVPEYVNNYMKYNCKTCYEMASEIPETQVEKILELASKKGSIDDGTNQAIIKNQNR